MKKLISLLLIAIVCLSCAGCDRQPNVPTMAPPENKTPVPTAESTELPTAAPTETSVPTASSTAVPTVVPTEEVTETPAQTPTPVPSPTASPEPASGIKYVIGEGGVNVRTEPSASSAKLTTMPQNAMVTVLGKSGSWYYVEYMTGKTGYMAGQYLSDAPYVTPTPFVPSVTPGTYDYNDNLDLNDNVFLDALAYTGYNLEKHRADGMMWKFILGKDKPSYGYLSGLGYDYGKSTGYELNEYCQPDIEKFRKNGGLVCASYVTYVYFNYLPYVAGIDTSFLKRPENSRSAQSWRLAAEDWVKQGYSRKISFTAKRNSDGSIVFDPHEEIPIGSVVIFKVYNAADSASARHVGIYAGHAGGYHWMTHVGNERGPEMITMERMGYSSTPEIPLEIITPPSGLFHE